MRTWVHTTTPGPGYSSLGLEVPTMGIVLSGVLAAAVLVVHTFTSEYTGTQ